MTKHLHPLAIAVNLRDIVVQNFFWLILIGVNFRKLLQKGWFIPVCVGISGFFVGWAILKYWRFTFAIRNSALTIHYGIIVRHQEHIPFSRIQTVRENQPWYLRPLGLYQLEIETSGKSLNKAEAQLAVVSAAVVRELAQRRQSNVDSESQEITADTPVHSKTAEATYDIKNRDLNIFALTSQGIVPVILVLSWIVNKLQEWLPAAYWHKVERSFAGQSLLILAVLILGVLVIGLLVSYAQQLIKFFHFHAQRQGHQLLISQGLFSRHQTTTDLKRIQAICLSQTALRQIFHLVSVELLLAASQDSGQQKNVLAVPVIQRSAVWQQLKQLLQISVDLNFKLTQIVSQNRWYYLRNNFLWSLLIVIHMTGWRWPWGG